jgi:RNA-directed DNA polymerase
MTYCGKFYRTDLGSMLRRINAYRMRQARREFRRLRSHKRAWR